MALGHDEFWNTKAVGRWLDKAASDDQKHKFYRLYRSMSEFKRSTRSQLGPAMLSRA